MNKVFVYDRGRERDESFWMPFVVVVQDEFHSMVKCEAWRHKVRSDLHFTFTRIMKTEVVN